MLSPRSCLLCKYFTFYSLDRWYFWSSALSNYDLTFIITIVYFREEPMIPDDHDEVDMNDYDPENDRQGHR